MTPSGSSSDQAEKQKVLIFGAHSLVGEDVAKKLKESFQVESHSRKDLDLTNLEQVENVLINSDYDMLFMLQA